MLSTIDQTNLAGPGSRVGGNLHVISLHLDFAAASRARWATNLMLKRAGEHWVCTKEMWKLDSLLTAHALRKISFFDVCNG